MILGLVSLWIAHGAPVLPSYTEALVVTQWHQTNTLIEDACGPAALSTEAQCHAPTLKRAISTTEAFQSKLFHDPRLEYLIGLSWRFLNEPSKAKKKFRLATELDPARQDAWHDLGELCLADLEYDEAKIAFQHVSDLVSTGSNAWLGPWRLAEIAAFQQDISVFETQMREALRRGFSFYEIQGSPTWRQFYNDPIIGDVITKFITVYGDVKILDSLR